ncbi:hypothetical protein BDI4_470014 [Burkholderia diffusa]|nr:hypothetical protein BDI4_470014 [Burkholderia diffusa]
MKRTAIDNRIDRSVRIYRPSGNIAERHVRTSGTARPGRRSR